MRKFSRLETIKESSARLYATPLLWNQSVGVGKTNWLGSSPPAIMAALMMLAMFHVFNTLPEASTSMFIGFEVGGGIRVHDNPDFATVDIVMEIDYAEIAVIAKQGDSAIELDSRQLVAMT